MRKPGIEGIHDVHRHAFDRALGDAHLFAYGFVNQQVIDRFFHAVLARHFPQLGRDLQIDRFAGRNFVFLPISRGEKREDVAAFREKMGYTFPMGLDPSQAIYDRYASNYIPRNFLIGADGKVMLATVGYDAEEFDEMIKTIEKTLE